MKRTLSLLLTALLLIALPGAPAFAEPALSDALEAQAFAAAMAVYDGNYPSGSSLAEPDLLWAATGWYAAWLFRTAHVDLLDEAHLRDFQRSLGAREDEEMSVEWAENVYGVRLLRRSDGSASYDFPRYKERMDELLGQSVEFLLAAPAADAVTASVRQHYEGDAVSERRYALRFEPNPAADSFFPYCLEEITEQGLSPALDPALDFDWDGLLAANSLQGILAQTDSVRISNNVEGAMPIWLFRRGGRLCILRTGEDYAEGEYRGCWYIRERGEDGALRARISGFDPDCGDETARDAYVSNYVFGAVRVALDRIDGDLIRTHVTYAGDWEEDVAVDRGTLRLREITSRIDGWSEPVTVRFDDGEPLPDVSYLDSWDEPLRHVTLVWEDWESGERRVRTEVVDIPRDWEYVPWEGRWGDYTIYMNEGYTQPYAYPGDGADYTLYLTTAKG